MYLWNVTLFYIADNIAVVLGRKDKILNTKKSYFSEIPHVVLLTQIDKICEGLQWDVSMTFSIPAIDDIVKKVADLMGLPHAHILPIKNYEREMHLRKDISILALLALKQILNFADDYLAKVWSYWRNSLNCVDFKKLTFNTFNFFKLFY